MSNITVNDKIKNDWLDVVRDNIDAKPLVTWVTAPARIVMGSTATASDLGTYPYVFKSSSFVDNVVSVSILSGVATLVCTGHLLQVGEIITISGAVPAQLNASWTVASVPGVNSITFNVMDMSDTTATGSITFKRNIAPKGVSEPTWPSSPGATATEGKIVWTNIGGLKGKLRIYSGTRPTQGTLITTQVLLAELLFSDPSAPDASSSTLNFSAITPDSSANATGTASWARILDCSDTPVYDCSVSNLAGSGDIKISNTQITALGTVSVSSASISIT